MLVPASPATSFGVSMLPMRILLWHGYLLGGTGSNVYILTPKLVAGEAGTSIES